MMKQCLSKISIALLLSLFSMSVMAIGGSIYCPWIIDTAPKAVKLPPIKEGIEAFISVVNTDALTPITCTIAYFSASGTSLGPVTPNNTFIVSAGTTVSFRPCIYDPSTVAGGQESATGWVVPDRPTTDGEKTGSVKISWTVGNYNTIVGAYHQAQAITLPLSTADPNGTTECRVFGQTRPMLPVRSIVTGALVGITAQEVRDAYALPSAFSTPVTGSVDKQVNDLRMILPASAPTKIEMISTLSEIMTNIFDYPTIDMSVEGSIGLKTVTFLQRALGN